MLDSLVNLFTSYCSYWPLACFFILLLAGLNVPVSEDAIIIISAGVAYAEPSLFVPNWVGLILGIWVSDLISYCFGRLMSKGMRQIKAVRKKLTPKKIRVVSKTLDDYGFRTFIVCRFIPFGVRNTLFMCSGFVRLPVRKFILYDFIAGLISCSVLYSLIYFMGQEASIWFKACGIILFAALIITFVILVIRIFKKESDSAESEEVASALEE